VTAMEPPDGVDVLRTPQAGALVIRGGLVRIAGYGLTVLFAAVTSVFLLRSLGVEDFGVYGVVAALLGIVSSLTEAGLTQVGSRDLPLRPAQERGRLLGTLLGVRIGLTAAGVLVAGVFAWAAGYEDVAVAGVLIAGLGVLLVNTQVTATLPLRIELRLGTVTFFDVLAQALTCFFVGVLAAVGASLLPYFGVQVAVGAILLAGTLAVVGPRLARPRLDRAEARLLLREALPLAAAVALNVVYLRLLVVLVSLLEDDTETGLFATSFRTLELLIGLPTIVLAIALPVLAVAGAEDRERFRYGFQRLSEVALVVACPIVLLTVVLADPAIRLLYGEEYADAAPILQVQALALVPVFVAQAWTLGLVALRRQRSVAFANAIALAAVVVLGLALVPPFGTTGAAVAGVVTESVLALALLGALVRLEPDAAPRLGFAWRPLVAVAAAAVVPIALDLSGWVEAPLAAAVFGAAAFVVHAVPEEILPALRGRGPQ
jgi:O-antigen/teichoic acid export membrane protein